MLHVQIKRNFLFFEKETQVFSLYSAIKCSIALVVPVFCSFQCWVLGRGN